MAAHPDTKIIHASYTQARASSENRKIQRIMLSREFRTLFPNVRIPSTDGALIDRDMRMVRNSQMFEIIGTGGQYICAGVGGPITGEGMKLGILDDPIKNAAEADSKLYRDKIWEWWDSTLLSRDEGDNEGDESGFGDTALVVTATRWHEDDPIGRILARAKRDGEKWLVLKFEALREDMADKQDPRKKGQALWPAKFSQQKVEKTKKRLLSGEGGTGERWWNALYQQTPHGLEGMLFKRRYWKEYDEDEEPNYIGIVHSWDTASDTKTYNDWSVCEAFKIWIDKNGNAVGDLFDVWRERVEYPELKQQAIDLGYRDNPMWVLIERKSSGIALIQDLLSSTKLPIWRENDKTPYGVVPVKDKVGRAMPTTGKIASGKIRIPRNAPWKADFLTEHAEFPNGTFDDRVDAQTQFTNWFQEHFVVPQQKIISGAAAGRSRNRL